MSGDCAGQASSSDPFVRAFVAIEIGADVRAKLAAVLESLRETQAHVGWVPAPNIHLSLAFLGNVTREMVPLIGAALDEAVSAARPFAFDVSGLGQFGSRQSPRVIWAGVRECTDLMRLQERVAAGLTALGLALEEREYHPHLTLGRVRSPRGREDLAHAMEVAGAVVFGRVAASEVVLMQSRLMPAGARYSVLHRARCGLA